MDDSMNDFQDFLTRDCAYVVLGEFKPGKFAEARNIYEEAVSTFAHGFKVAYLLQEPGTDRGISFIVWKSIDDMEASHTELYNTILKKMDPLFADTPQPQVYEVICEIHSNSHE